MTRTNAFWKSLYTLSTALLFWGCQTPTVPTTDLLQWVPQNTTAVFQINDLNEWEKLHKNHPLVKTLTGVIPQLSSRLQAFPSPPNDPLLVALTPYGKDKNALTLAYKAAIDSSYFKRPSIDYSGQKVYITEGEKSTLFTTFFEDYTLHSDTKIVLENCIRNFRIQATGVLANDFYSSAKTADPKATLNMHLLGKAKQGITKTLGTWPLFPNIGQHWTSLDIDFSSEGMALDGLEKIVDSLGNPLNLLQNSAPQKMLIEQAIPQNFVSFLAFPLANFLTVEDQFKQWVQYHNVPLREVALKKLQTIDEVGLIQMNNGRGVVLHTRDENQAKADFLPDQKGTLYRGSSYFSTELSPALKTFLGILGAPIEAKWVTQIEDFILLSDRETTLKTMMASLKEQNVLSQSERYQDFKSSALFDAFHLLWIAQPEYLKTQQEKAPIFKDFAAADYPYMAFQGIVEENYLHQHYRLFERQKDQSVKSTQETALFSLDQPLAHRPQWLKNHRSKQKDIAVQDSEHTLYLFSNTGKLFWKKQLAGPIVGPIQQVDLYKNGRLQMAFRTPKRFYILDRNGKVVKPFDLKVSDSDPVQPLAVFDYDQRRDYRFVLAQGNSLKMLDGKGKTVRGFTFKKTATPIVTAPKHLRIDKKDYIAITEESGQLHLLSRTGKARVKSKEKITVADQDIYAYQKTFTTTDRKGNLIQIDPSGPVVKTPLALGSRHALTATTKSLVTLSGNTLVIKGLPVTLPFGEYTAPQIFYLNNTIYVATTDVAANKVHLYYSDGKAVPGFPLYGSSVIDLANADKDGALEMVVQTAEKDISIYKIKD